MEGEPVPVWDRVRSLALRVGEAVLNGFAAMGDAYYMPEQNEYPDQVVSDYDIERQVAAFREQINRT
jgi:hypothetical protein